MQVIVKFVFFQVRIIDVVFQVLLKTFLEKFYILYSLVSCLGVCHTELRQIECCSVVIVLVNVYYLCLVVLFYHQCFFCFLGSLLGCMNFSHWLSNVLHGLCDQFSCVHVKTLCVFDKNF